MTTLREFAEELRASAEIAEIISSYIPLKRAGANFKTLCPFHKEKTPSFFVSPARQIFHCFGCGVGGDVIKFIVLYEKVSYREALEILAKKLGKEMPKFQPGSFDSEKAQYRNMLIELHGLALEFFRNRLAEKRTGTPARDYLRKRGISQESIDKFSLGYAPAQERAFLEFARSRGYSEKALLDAGLVVKHNDNARYYDRFRHRLIFPIRDHLGKCVGFGGRGLSDDATPKYLNSPETLIYSKGSILYGLDIAKHEITRQQMAIISEGYFDVIVLHQFGFTNSVATLGTALTEQQARLLKRFCSKVLFLYDGDEAGEQAMLRGAEVLFRNQIQIKVLLLPEGHDPDSFLMANGADALRRYIEKNSVDLIEFFLHIVTKRYDLQTPEGKVAVLDLFRPLLTEIENVIYYNQYIKMLAETLKLDELLVKQYIQHDSGRHGHRDDSASHKDSEIYQRIVDASKSRTSLMEIALLRILLDCPEARPVLKQHIDCNWVMDKNVRYWVERLLDAAHTEEIDIIHLLEECEEQDSAFTLRQAALWEHLSPDYRTHLEEIPRRLHLRYEKMRRRKLIEDINRYYQLSKEYQSARKLLTEIHLSSKKLTEING